MSNAVTNSVTFFYLFSSFSVYKCLMSSDFPENVQYWCVRNIMKHFLRSGWTVRPRCLYSVTLQTGAPLELRAGWLIWDFLQENNILVVCLFGSGLKVIFHWKAHWLITSRSWFKLKAVICGSSTTEYIIVPSAKI